MPDSEQTFAVRDLGEQLGWVIDHLRSDGTTEQLVGVYVSEDFAQRWIATLADTVKDVIAPPSQ